VSLPASLYGGPGATFARLAVEQGLSQNTVQVILQDAAGFLWFGTEEGLNRYDGYAVRVFKHDPNRPGSLPDDTITALKGMMNSSVRLPMVEASDACKSSLLQLIKQYEAK